MTDGAIDFLQAATDGHAPLREPQRPRAVSMRAVSPLFVGLALLMVGNGLSSAAIGVRSTLEGFSITTTGVIMAGYFAGFLLAPSVVVGLVHRVGHIRVFAGLASVASSAILTQSVWVAPVAWTLMRGVFGFCAAGLYIVIESWLGSDADVSNRGRTLSVYMIVSMAGLGGGQYLIAWADPSGFRLFALSAALVSLSLVPLTLTAATRAPDYSHPGGMTLGELMRIVPTGVVTSLMNGMSVGVVLGLGAVYATSVGLSLEQTGWFLAAPTVGAITMQWPIGYLSDRVSRRLIIWAVALIGALLCFVLAAFSLDGVQLLVLMFLLGGSMFPLYSLVVSYTLDWVPDERGVAALGTLIRVNGVGALIGPLVAATLMSRLGVDWFFWMMMIAFGTVVLFVGWRLVFIAPLALDRQHAFVAFPARASTLAAQLVDDPAQLVDDAAQAALHDGALRPRITPGPQRDEPRVEIPRGRDHGRMPGRTLTRRSRVSR